VTLEDDLQKIKDAEKNAEQALTDAGKQAEGIKSKAKETTRQEEEAALDKTREVMAGKEKTLVDAAQKEGDIILKNAEASIVKLKAQAEKNKKTASDYLVEEILKQ